MYVSFDTPAGASEQKKTHTIATTPGGTVRRLPYRTYIRYQMCVCVSYDTTEPPNKKHTHTHKSNDRGRHRMMAPTCGMMVSLDLKAESPIVLVSTPSMATDPPSQSTILNRTCMRLLLPLPVRPTMPTFSPGLFFLFFWGGFSISSRIGPV